MTFLQLERRLFVITAALRRIVRTSQLSHFFALVGYDAFQKFFVLVCNAPTVCNRMAKYRKRDLFRF